MKRLRKNTEIAHFVLKKCTFRFRDYTEKKKLLYAICKDSEKGLQRSWAKANEYIKEQFKKTYYATKKTPTLASLGLDIDIEDGTLCWRPFDFDLREIYCAYKDFRQAEDSLHFNKRVIFEVYGQLVNKLIEDKAVMKSVKKAGGQLYADYKEYSDLHTKSAKIDNKPKKPGKYDKLVAAAVKAYEKTCEEQGDTRPLTGYEEKTQNFYIATCEFVSKDPVLSEKYPQCAKILKVDITSASEQKADLCRSAYKVLLGKIKNNKDVTFETLSDRTNLPVEEERKKLAKEDCDREFKERPRLKERVEQRTGELDKMLNDAYEQTMYAEVTEDIFENLLSIAYEKNVNFQYDMHNYSDWRHSNTIIYYNDSIMYIRNGYYSSGKDKKDWFRLKDGRWCNPYDRNMIIYSKELTKEMIPFLADKPTSNEDRLFVDVLGKRRISIDVDGNFYKKDGLVERKDISEAYSESYNNYRSYKFIDPIFCVVQKPGEDINDYILAFGKDYSAPGAPKEVWDTMPYQEYQKLRSKAFDAHYDKENTALFAKYGEKQVRSYWQNDKEPFIGMTWNLFKGEYLPVWGGDIIKENSNGDRVVRQYRLSHYRYFYFYNGKLHHWVDK